MAKNSGCGMGCGSWILLFICVIGMIFKGIISIFGPNDSDTNSDLAYSSSSYSSNYYYENTQYESSDSATESTTAPEVKMSKKEYIASCSNYSDSDFQTEKKDAVGKHVKVKLMIADKASNRYENDIMGNPTKTYWQCNIYDKDFKQYSSHPLYFEDTGKSYDGHKIELYDELTVYGTVTENSAPITLRNDGSISVPFLDVKYVKYGGKFGE
jgi:hypothetical protein